MNMAPNMAAMGGGQMPQQEQASQFTPQQFNPQQIMQRAQSADLDQKKAYQAELVNQLRGGTFKGAQGVWSNVFNTYDQGQQEQAFQNSQMEKQKQMEMAQAGGNWAAGEGG